MINNSKTVKRVFRIYISYNMTYVPKLFIPYSCGCRKLRLNILSAKNFHLTVKKCFIFHWYIIIKNKNIIYIVQETYFKLDSSRFNHTCKSKRNDRIRSFPHKCYKPNNTLKHKTEQSL